jgi:hypothetical protein
MASLLAKRLYNLRLRARRRGLPANLYLSAWLDTLEDFQERCAYCDTGLGFTIDHFQPLMRGGPTSVDNCLPCCQFCNTLKGALPPELVFHVPKERIEHLRLYLKRRGAGLRGWPLAEMRSHAQTPYMTLHIKKEESMTIEQMQRSKISLPHGREVIITTTPSQIVLQLQQHKQSDDDLLTPVVNVAAALTPAECVALAGELLRMASPLLATPPTSTPNSLSNYTL